MTLTIKRNKTKGFANWMFFAVLKRNKKSLFRAFFGMGVLFAIMPFVIYYKDIFLLQKYNRIEDEL